MLHNFRSKNKQVLDILLCEHFYYTKNMGKRFCINFFSACHNPLLTIKTKKHWVAWGGGRGKKWCQSFKKLCTFLYIIVEHLFYSMKYFLRENATCMYYIYFEQLPIKINPTSIKCQTYSWVTVSSARKNLGFSINRDNSLCKKRTELGVLCCVCFRAVPGGAYCSFNEYWFYIPCICSSVPPWWRLTPDIPVDPKVLLHACIWSTYQMCRMHLKCMDPMRVLLHQLPF